MVVEFKFNGFSYFTKLKYIGDIEVKLDTGSPVTILSCTQLALLLSCNKKQMVQIIKNSNVKRQYFKSYTGNDIETVLCKLRNVRLGNSIISNFYFYLNLDTEAKGNALIGVDFIKCCSISGCPNNSINLNYCNEWRKTTNSQVFNIDEIISHTISENDLLLQGALMI